MLAWETASDVHNLRLQVIFSGLTINQFTAKHKGLFDLFKLYFLFHNNNVIKKHTHPLVSWPLALPAAYSHYAPHYKLGVCLSDHYCCYVSVVVPVLPARLFQLQFATVSPHTASTPVCVVPFLFRCCRRPRWRLGMSVNKQNTLNDDRQTTEIIVSVFIMIRFHVIFSASRWSNTNNLK